MKPPDATELVGPPPLGLDEKSVLGLFLGKSKEDALRLFGERPCTEEFAYMAPAGFLYYIEPAFEYLKSEKSAGDWEFAHGLLCSLSCRVGNWGVDDTQLRVIREIADYCDVHRVKWNIGTGDLLQEYLETIRK